MIEIDEALALYECSLQPLAIETISITDALHRVLTETLHAATDLPRFDQSAMDGYAFTAADIATASASAPCWLPIVERVAAGDAPAKQTVPTGCAARILTGAPLPIGADTVIPQENVQLDNDRLLFTETYPTRRNIRWRGEELQRDTVVAAAGARITPGLLAAAINAGIERIRVRRQPRMRILVSGDEVKPSGTTLAPGQIPDSNGPLLRAILHGWGFPTPVIEHVGDDALQVREALSRAFDDADIVISTGGASVGDRDYLPTTAETLGVRRVLWKVAQKPGKPLYFGVHDQHARRPLMLALPGNPGAVLIGATLHLRRILDLLEGAQPALPQWFDGELTAEVERDSRRTRLVRMRLSYSGAQIRLQPLPHQDSHMLSNLSAADVLVRVEAGDAPVATGSRVPWLYLPV
jgi:molybdopterin molybdotransferase